MPQKAIDLFFTIEHPDRVTFSILFNACARLGTSQALAVGKQVFSTLPLQYQRAVDVLHSLSNMFIKCGDVKSAESLFDRLQRDVKCYGSLMKMYNSRNEMDKTLKLFQRMEEEHIEPNDLIFVLLIDACSETGDLSLCESIMPKIPKDSLSNLWILNSLVDMWVSQSILSQENSSIRVNRAKLVKLQERNKSSMESYNQMPCRSQRWVILLWYVHEFRGIRSIFPIQLTHMDWMEWVSKASSSFIKLHAICWTVGSMFVY